MRTTLIRTLIVMAIAAVAALGLLTASSTAGGRGNVTISGSTLSSYGFKPATVTIQKGQKVHWSWSSNAPHNVTFKKLGKHSHTGASESYSLKFTKPGTYHYLCTIHGFKGKVVVK